MRGLLKNPLLNLVGLKIHNVKRIRFIINIGIFLAVFAVTASVITIYYEGKIDKIEKTILDNQELLQISEFTLSTLPSNLVRVKSKINTIKKTQLFFNLNNISNVQIFSERHISYIPFIYLYGRLEVDLQNIDSLKDTIMISDDLFDFVFRKRRSDGTLIETDWSALQEKLLNDENLKKKYSYWVKNYNKLKKRETELLKIKNLVEKQYTEFLGTKDNISSQKSLDDISRDPSEVFYNKYKEYLNFVYETYSLLEELQLETIKILRNETNKVKKDNLVLHEAIFNLSNTASKIILFAFSIQLIIFLIIQSLEISSTVDRKEK